MSGLKRLPVWIYFDTKKEVGKAGCRATYKKCGKEMQGLVARLKQHYHECTIFIDFTDDASADLCILNPDIQVLPHSKRNMSDIRLDSQAKKQKSVKSRMTNFVVQTSTTEKAAIDLQIARFVCATNSPFTIVEHPEFMMLMAMLRPGYHPPNRHDVGNELLDELYNSMQSECKEQLEGKMCP